MFIVLKIKAMQEQKIITPNGGQMLIYIFFSIFPTLFTKHKCVYACTQLNT